MYRLRLSSRGSATLMLATLTLVALALTSSACSAVVASRLADKPASDDAATMGCTPGAMCLDGTPCKGPDVCSPDGTCVSGTAAAPDGTPCNSDSDPANGEICGMGACHLPFCGDGIVSAPELCDDGNPDPNDGCRPNCTFTCQNDMDCQDGNECDGAEVCTVGRVGERKCREAALLPPDGTPCTKPDMNMGACGMGICL